MVLPVEQDVPVIVHEAQFNDRTGGIVSDLPKGVVITHVLGDAVGVEGQSGFFAVGRGDTFNQLVLDFRNGAGFTSGDFEPALYPEILSSNSDNRSTVYPFRLSRPTTRSATATLMSTSRRPSGQTAPESYS